MNLTEFGNYEQAKLAIAKLLKANNEDEAAILVMAEKIVQKVIENIASAIEQLLKEWQDSRLIKFGKCCILSTDKNLIFI